MARRSGVVAALIRMQREAERQRARQARAAAQSQRAATAARTRAGVQDQKLRDRMYAEDRMQEAADDTAQVEHQVEILQSVLATTLGVDDYLDLEALKQPPPYPVFDPLSVGTPPSAPSPSDFAVEGPSALGRVFAASKHAARAEQRQAEYEQALTAIGPRRNNIRSGWKRRDSNMTRTSPVRPSGTDRTLQRSARCNAAWRRVNRTPSSATWTSCWRPQNTPTASRTRGASPTQQCPVISSSSTRFREWT